MFNMFKRDGKVVEELKLFSENNVQDYFYFIKVVPHAFMDYID